MATESNPFRPDVPEDFRQISQNLYDYLRESAETLREQHNLTQAGDTTFSWEMLTQIDSDARYTLGALGRFYHPSFGIIIARYCRFQSMFYGVEFGSPLGIVKTLGKVGWSVTNNLGLSSPDLVLGLGGFNVMPPDGYFGWVIVHGASVRVLLVDSDPELFTKLVWNSTGGAADSKLAAGRVFASVVGLNGINEISPTEFEIPAGLVFIDQQAESEKRIKDWVQEELQTLEAQLTELQATVTQITGSGGLADITVRLSAAESAITANTAMITQQGEIYSANFVNLNNRVTALEQSVSDLVSTGGVGSLSFDLNNLTNSFNTYVGTNNAVISTMQSQINNALTVTTSVPSQLTAINSQLSGIGLRITNLTFGQLADVPDSYAGQSLKIVRVNAAESGVEFATLTAAMSSTTAGGYGDVQTALTQIISRLVAGGL